MRNTPKSPWRTIVGVAGDERDDGVTKAAPTIIYWPVVVQDLWQPGAQVQRSLAYAIRSERSESPTLLKEVQAAVWAVNPSLPVAAVQTLQEIQSDSMAQTSFALVMLSIAAGVALLLGVVGIYGVISYIAAQRTREIGIRMALGAAQRDVSSLFLRHGLHPLRDRHRGGSRGRRGIDAVDGLDALRRQPARLGDVSRRCAGARRDGVARQLPAGGARRATGSIGGAAR